MLSVTVLKKILGVHLHLFSQTYPRSDVKRTAVPDDRVPWSVAWEDYSPVDHTSQSVLDMPVWADKDFRKEE